MTHTTNDWVVRQTSLRHPPGLARSPHGERVSFSFWKQASNPDSSASLDPLRCLGAGERAAIAVVLNRGYALAIDGSRPIRRALEEAGIAGNALRILHTQDIMIELIRFTLMVYRSRGCHPRRLARQPSFQIEEIFVLRTFVGGLMAG